MSTQHEVTVTFVEKFESYVTDSKSMGELKTRLEDSRKILEPVIRAHRIPIEPKAENVKAWKVKREIFLPLVEAFEGPIPTDDNPMSDDDMALFIKRREARIIAWLGVIKTCLELQILPTDKNADRLRKTRVWTALNGNGKVNPNWVDPKAKKPEPEPEASKPEPEASKPEPEASKPEFEVKTSGKASGKASNKPATTQKANEATHPLTSSVSSSETPISAREHFGTLWMQLAKNEVFKHEFLDMLAASLEVPRATLTNVMWQSAEQIIRGTK